MCYEIIFRFGPSNRQLGMSGGRIGWLGPEHQGSGPVFPAPVSHPTRALTLTEAVRSVASVSEHPTLDLALRLWSGVRDGRAVEDPTDLDALLAAQGQPGAPGHDCGLTDTFACFPPGADAALTLPSGEPSASHKEARLLGHLLVTRTLVAAGLALDERVVRAMSAAYALSWTTEGGAPYHTTPLVLAVSLWLVALDPQSSADRPLPIDWSAACFERDWWDRDYRLFSHYDIRERALDWAAYVARDPARHPGCVGWTIAEPLLRLGADSRVGIAMPLLAASAEAPPSQGPVSESPVSEGRASRGPASQGPASQGRASEGAPLPAAASLERGRIALLVQGYLQSTDTGDDGPVRPAAGP